jgi:hypothetical protein
MTPNASNLGASQFRRLARIPQPLLPKRAKGSKTFQSPSPLLGEGFRVRVTKVGCSPQNLNLGLNAD